MEDRHTHIPITMEDEYRNIGVIGMEIGVHAFNGLALQGSLKPV